jgi:hypothetical protein
MKVNFGVDDLTKSALKRLVEQLLASNDGEEKKILDQLAQREKDDKERNDLADLVREKRGSPSRIDADEEEMEVKKGMA